MNHMCQKCAANIGKTELTYMPTIVTEDEESDLKEEEEMKYRPRHILCLNIRNASPSPVCKKQCTSSVVGKKDYITVNRERNKRRKGSDSVSKKDNKKNLQNLSQHKVRQMNFIFHMVNI